ncbi:MAG TPA: AsmA family protein, partial [Thermoanaerobaculia bacterium]
MTLELDSPEAEMDSPEPPVRRRRILRVVAAIVGLLIILLAALPYVVSLESARSRALAGAEAALHRKVEAGAIRLRILSGLGVLVDKVVVRNKTGWGTPALLTADRVSVKLALWPLLSRRVVIRKVVLDGVTFTVERNAQGNLNVDDFLSAGSRRSEGAKPATAAAFLAANVEIPRGRLQLVDRKVVAGETRTTTLEELAGHIRDIGPSTAARF